MQVYARCIELRTYIEYHKMLYTHKTISCNHKTMMYLCNHKTIGVTYKKQARRVGLTEGEKEMKNREKIQYSTYLGC